MSHWVWMFVFDDVDSLCVMSVSCVHPASWHDDLLTHLMQDVGKLANRWKWLNALLTSWSCMSWADPGSGIFPVPWSSISCWYHCVFRVDRQSGFNYVLSQGGAGCMVLHHLIRWEWFNHFMLHQLKAPFLSVCVSLTFIFNNFQILM